MKFRAWLAVGLVVIPVALSAADKKSKGKDKDKSAPAAPVVTLTPGEEAVKKAQEKIALGQTEPAKRILETATQVEGMTGEPFLLYAQLLEPTTEWERAAGAYKTASERLSGPAKAEALARLSILQDVNGIGEAAASAEAAVAADPEGAWPAVALARQRVHQKRADEALTLAQKALAAAQAAGVAPAAQTAVGLAQEAHGDLPAAEAAYRAALAADADSISANLCLARVLRLTNRVAEAAPILKALQDRTPWLAAVYGENVRVKLALGQYVQALEDATTASYLPGADEAAATQLVNEVKIARAVDDVRNGRANLAIDDLKQLREEQPRSVEVRVGLAKAYVENREIDAAVAELNKTIEMAPDSAEAYFQLGLIQQDVKKNSAAALTAYQKASALDPQNVSYCIRLGNLLAAQGQAAQAVAELTKVVEGPGANNGEAWTYLIGAHLSAQKYKDAATTGEKALAIIGEAPEARPLRALACGYLGWAYLNLGDADNFKKYGAMARDLGYDNKDFLDRLRRVEGGEALASAAKAPPARPRPRRRR
jgi:tetratricopeptide (TPR) repeat protein